MPEINTNDKDIDFLRAAYEISGQTDDPKASIDKKVAVGAVVVIGDRIVSASANRFPPQLRARGLRIEATSQERYYLIEHAERCAIYDGMIAGIQLSGATMYVTRFPCIDCARAICYVAIARLVVGAGFRHERQWLKSQ